MKKDAFVIMPFSPTPSCKDWTEIYDHVFRPSLVDLGWTCERASPETGSLIASIVDKLSTVTVVLADVTDRNANVFYELGVRHSLSRRTIMVSQSTEHVPSDLKGYWHVVYGLMPAKITQFREDLKRILARIEEDPDRNDNPVADYLTIKNHSVVATENKQNVKRLNALLTEINGNIFELDALLQDKSPPGPRALLSTSAISLLLDTYYVDLGTEALRLAYEFRRSVVVLAQAPQSPNMVAVGLGLGRKLQKIIAQARDDIQRGSFVEPVTPSFMQWMTSSPSRRLTTYSCSHCGAPAESDPCPVCNSSDDHVRCR
ncbi:hypothetical protein [Bradyrhizobium roseum]|uniref:hypothetical protein n=1 Tax=Bradyrhizobium roseum TaxID=3056648 RepID=UPI002614D53D|nr:hypothetical protein [Bradyrhizobium roseus]WKA26384.1 hypothetical protein QUH67_22605 [Bradyrhizobium roseus]